MESIPRAFGPANWHPHYEAVLNWVMLNPHRNDSEGAKELGFTPAWFSLIINSDTFKDRLREEARARGIEMGIAGSGIYGKMIHAADLAMDETIRRLETHVASDTFVSDARNNILAKLGYSKEAPPESPKNVTNILSVNVASLREARALLDKKGTGTTLDTL